MRRGGEGASPWVFAAHCLVASHHRGVLSFSQSCFHLLILFFPPPSPHPCSFEISYDCDNYVPSTPQQTQFVDSFQTAALQLFSEVRPALGEVPL